jgi:BirA family biotin operon repressor/biotin-[acetyl-CoA-carboxylase] ligase
VEALASGPSVAVAVGLGVNLRVEFPSGVAGASLHALVPAPPAPAMLFAAYVGELAERLGILQSSGVAGLREEWLTHAVGIGEVVTARSSAGIVTGTAEGIDNDGALLVAAAGGTVRVLAGDVHIGLPPPG